LNTVFADLMFKYEGLSVMAEYAIKGADGGPLVLNDADQVIAEYYTGNSYNVQAGYMLPSNIEFAVRYTDVNAETATDEKHYTFGLNKFFVGHKLKIQTDFSFIDRVDRQNTALWRTQLDIHF